MAHDIGLLPFAILPGFCFAFVAWVALRLANQCNQLIAIRVARLSCGIALLCVLFSDPTATRSKRQFLHEPAALHESSPPHLQHIDSGPAGLFRLDDLLVST